MMLHFHVNAVYARNLQNIRNIKIIARSFKMVWVYHLNLYFKAGSKSTSYVTFSLSFVRNSE